jgi:hypothetical protein
MKGVHKIFFLISFLEAKSFIAKIKGFASRKESSLRDSILIKKKRDIYLD